MAQKYEWRAVWLRPGAKRTQASVFQREYNLRLHLAWVRESAYHLVAVQRRVVGAWEEVSDPEAPNPESGSAAAHTAAHSPDPAT